MNSLEALARQFAGCYGIDPPLVCAVVEQESGWNPYAVRFEPAFLSRYVVPLGIKDVTEQFLRSTSVGLMQVMGEVARELGYEGDLLRLTVPEVALDLGCHHLANKLKQAGGDFHGALRFWNGGGNPKYADEVLERRAKYEVSNGV